MTPEPSTTDAYLAAEARVRVEIERQLEGARWIVHDRRDLNLCGGRASLTASSRARERSVVVDHHAPNEGQCGSNVIDLVLGYVEEVRVEDHQIG